MPLYLVTAKQIISAKNGRLEKGMSVEVVSDHPGSICTKDEGKTLIEAVKNKYGLELQRSHIDTNFFGGCQLENDMAHFLLAWSS